MQSAPVIPRQVIEAYDFSILPVAKENLDTVKQVLTNHFNALFCEHHLKTGQPLPAVQVALGIPAAIKELYSKDAKIFSQSPVSLDAPANGRRRRDRKSEEKKEPFWTETRGDDFVSFLKEEYVPSTYPETKFKDALTTFVKLHPEIRTQLQWNSRYQPLCEKAGVKVERVFDPNYPKSEGTYHLHLRAKNAAPVAAVPSGTLPSTTDVVSSAVKVPVVAPSPLAASGQVLLPPPPPATVAVNPDYVLTPPPSVAATAPSPTIMPLPSPLVPAHAHVLQPVATPVQLVQPTPVLAPSPFASYSGPNLGQLVLPAQQ